jgi:site-specific recombinase XerD
MPYGFIEYLENKGYSDETVRSYQKVLKQFFSFISRTYNKHLEPYEINPLDIKNYLEEQRDREKSITTINKELAIIKTLFHYLWEINKVPVDPTVKLKRFKVDKNLALDITLSEIREVLKSVLSNPSYTPLRKAIFILATKGLKTAEFRFKKEDVFEVPGDDSIKIFTKNRKIILKDTEAACFTEYFYESMFNDSDYVFTTKHRDTEKNGPIQVMSILNHLRVITEDYLPEKSTPLTLLSIRRAIAYDLYIKKVPIQQIAKELGIEESSTTNYLKKLAKSFTNQKKLEAKFDNSV